MNKLTFMRLWDVYGGLLTPTKREMTDMYFNLDLTVSEIAEAKGISRQGVSECLASCKKQLAEYEEKLHVLQILDESLSAAETKRRAVADWAQNFLNNNPQFKEEIKRLSEIVQSD